jgi:hypothetical protein
MKFYKFYFNNDQLDHGPEETNASPNLHDKSGDDYYKQTESGYLIAITIRSEHVEKAIERMVVLYAKHIERNVNF